MVSIFEDFLRRLSGESITNTFFILMCLIFVFCIFSQIINRRSSEFKSYAPTLLTSLGILGTFVGIVSGLLNFDIENIDSSISQLLEGMKTAFSTSVIGVFLSIFLKIIYTLSKKKETKHKKDINVESVVANFYEQTEYLKFQNEQAKIFNDHIETMVKTLGSDSEGSLLGQIKLLRGDLSDSQKNFNKAFDTANDNLKIIKDNLAENKDRFSDFEKKLWDKLQNFADMMSKSATEAVIEALKKVIQDFNNNLTEQFGDNFKQLNQAVLELITWQENYRNQLNEMIALYNAGVQSLITTEKSVSTIEQSTKSIPDSMGKLDTVIRTNQQQIENLESHLEAFAQLRDKAVAAIPETQNQINHMLENVTQANNELTKGLKDGAEELHKNITNAGDILNKSIQNSAEILSTNIISVATAFNENTTKANNELQESSKHLEQTAEHIAQQNKNLTEHQKQLFDQITQFAHRWNKEFDENTKRIQEQFSRSVEDMIKKQIEESQRLMTTLEKESENALKTTGESVKKQLDLIDKSMQEEVNRVMQNMGSALATITNQFTNDYAKLTNAMAEIVRQQRGKF